MRSSYPARIPIHLEELTEEIHLTMDGPFYAIASPPYEGPYEADARFTEQVFPTKQKSMLDDFTVHAINYTEARNDSGITVTIGG